MPEKQSVVVYGPQGSGKTLHAEALRKHFHLDTVVEADAPHQVRKMPKTGALVLTIWAPEETRRTLHIDEALRRLRHEPPGYPFH
ncbi:MAG: ATP-binding protein [Comamonas sp.]